MASGGKKLRNNGGCFSEENPPLVSFSALMKRMQVIHKGRRYWAFGPMTDGRRWKCPLGYPRINILHPEHGTGDDDYL